MAYINTSNPVKIYINDKNYTTNLIQGTLSDDSVYSTNIVTTRGQITLGTTEEILDLDKTKFPIGAKIDLYVTINGTHDSRHPRGRLYVIDSSVNIQDLTTTLEVGCSLAFLSDKQRQYPEAIVELFDGSLTSTDRSLLQIEEYNLSNLNAYLDCIGKVIYQDPYGYIQRLNVFGNDGFGTSTSKFTSYDLNTALQVDSLSDTSVETDISGVVVDCRVSVPKLIPRPDEDEDEDEDEVPEEGEPLEWAEATTLNPTIDSVSHGNIVSLGQCINFTVSTTDFESGSKIKFIVQLSSKKLSSSQSGYITVGEDGTAAVSVCISSDATFDLTTYPGSNFFSVIFEASIKLPDPGESATDEEKQQYNERYKILELVSGDVEIDYDGDDEDQDDPQNFVPEPFVTTQLYRTIRIPRLAGGFSIEEEPDEDTGITDKSNPLTGSIFDPAPFAPPNFSDYIKEQIGITEDEPDEDYVPVDEESLQYILQNADQANETGPGSSFHYRGELGIEEDSIEESVVSGRSITYEPNTRQVLLETSWEWASSATYAAQANASSRTVLMEAIQTLANRVDGLLQKANQCYDERNTQLEKVIIDSVIYANPVYYFWHYHAEAYKQEAELVNTKVQRLIGTLHTIVDSNNDYYYLARATKRQNAYDPLGRLQTEIRIEYIHPLSVPDVKTYETSVTATNYQAPDYFRATPARDGTVAFVPAEKIMGLNIDIQEHPKRKLNQSFPTTDETLNSQIQNLVIASITTIRYTYTPSFIKKEEELRDSFDGQRDYKRVSYSSNGSTAPNLPDTIIEDVTADNAEIYGDVPVEPYSSGSGGAGSLGISVLGISVFNAGTLTGFFSGSSISSTFGSNAIDSTQYCDIETEEHDLSVTISTTSGNLSVSGPSWMGRPTSAVKTVSFPLQFLPIKPVYDPETQICDPRFNPSSKLRQYEGLVKKYAANIAKKIKGDNRAFRVTESMRPEIFAYYPYYPVTVSLETIGQAYRTRVTSASWAFDAQQSVCTLDCLVVAECQTITYPTQAEVNSILTDYLPQISAPAITAATHIADAGDFTAGTTDGNLSGDAGDFTAETAVPGMHVLNAGNFDDGTEVELPATPDPSDVAAESFTTDPEGSLGTTLQDSNGADVNIDTLAEVEAADILLYQVDINVSSVIEIIAQFTLSLNTSVTWNFGTISIRLSAGYDAGTIETPAALTLDFGSITEPLVPVLTSYVS